MQKSRLVMTLCMSILLITAFACSNQPAADKQEGKQIHKPGEKHEHKGEGEEAGPRLTIQDTYDTVRKGVRLILAYDSASSTFTGTVENVTKKTIKSVRVEVHLSNRVELGPTKPIDLAPGKKEKVKLSAAGQTF